MPYGWKTFNLNIISSKLCCRHILHNFTTVTAVNKKNTTSLTLNFYYRKILKVMGKSIMNIYSSAPFRLYINTKLRAVRLLKVKYNMTNIY